MRGFIAYLRHEGAAYVAGRLVGEAWAIAEVVYARFRDGVDFGYGYWSEDDPE